MKMANKLAGILILAVLFGCAGPPKLSDNRRFPKNPQFSITPEVVPDGAGLDFHAVYYLANDDPPAPGGNYYRFWPNGRVLVTFSSGPPSPAEADSFRSAYLGYYRLNGNQIAMEFYAPDPAKHRWSYGRVSAWIDRNGNVVKVRSQMGRHVWEGRGIFVKWPLHGLKRMPDW